MRVTSESATHPNASPRHPATDRCPDGTRRTRSLCSRGSRNSPSGTAQVCAEGRSARLIALAEAAVALPPGVNDFARGAFPGLKRARDGGRFAFRIRRFTGEEQCAVDGRGQFFAGGAAPDADIAVSPARERIALPVVVVHGFELIRDIPLLAEERIEALQRLLREMRRVALRIGAGHAWP